MEPTSATGPANSIRTAVAVKAAFSKSPLNSPFFARKDDFISQAAQAASPKSDFAPFSHGRKPSGQVDESVDFTTDVNRPWKRPKKEIARAYYRALHPHHSLSVWRTRPEDMGTLGAGISMYFLLLRGLIWVMLVLCVLSLPIMAMNYHGGNLHDIIERGTLGGFGDAVNVTSGEPFRMHFGRVKLNKSIVSVGMSVFELISVLAFLGAAIYLQRKQTKMGREADRNFTTINDYSIMVTEIPEDVEEPEELATFFQSQYGEVAAVDIAYNDKELLAHAAKRAKLVSRLEVAIGKCQKSKGARKDARPSEELMLAALKVQRDLQALGAKIRDLQSVRKLGAKTVAAFVTFREQHSKVVCFHHRLRGKLVTLCSGKRPLFRGTHDVKVQDAPMPSDVLWEHLECRLWNRRWRHLAAYAFKYIILFVSLVIVAEATKKRRQLTVLLASSSQCSATCTYEDAMDANGGELPSTLANRYLQCFEVARGGSSGTSSSGNSTSSLDCSGSMAMCYSCYCEDVTSWTSTLLQSAVFCESYVDSRVATMVSTIGIIAAVVAVNLLLKLVLMPWLARWEMHHTITTEQRSLTFKVFLAQLGNTVLIALIVNANLPRVSKAAAKAPGSLFEGEHSDMDASWYSDVGRTILITILVNGVADQLVALASFPLHWLVRRLRMGRVYTQAQLNKLYEGPEFYLALRTADMLNTLFVTMAFAGGLPMLQPIAFIMLACHFWMDKFELFRLCRKPPMYSNDLAAMSASLLPWAAVLRLSLSIWAYSAIQLDPDAASSTQLADGLSSGLSLDHGTPARLISRLFQRNTLHLTLLLAALLAALCLRLLHQNGVDLGKTLFGRCCAQIHPSDEDLPSFEEALRTRMLLGPVSYSMRDNPKYAYAFLEYAWGEDNDLSPRAQGGEIPPDVNKKEDEVEMTVVQSV
eukprot:jgi/Mesvir1/27009/Mv20716-RA.1